jgi:hypothetical protein
VKCLLCPFERPVVADLHIDLGFLGVGIDVRRLEPGGQLRLTVDSHQLDIPRQEEVSVALLVEFDRQLTWRKENNLRCDPILTVLQRHDVLGVGLNVLFFRALEHPLNFKPNPVQLLQLAVPVTQLRVFRVARVLRDPLELGAGHSGYELMVLNFDVSRDWETVGRFHFRRTSS